MKRIASTAVPTLMAIILLVFAFNIQPLKSKSRAWTIDGWAVLLEMNEFPEGYTDMPVGFINSERMQTALFSLGWQSDHVQVIHDNLTISVVQEAVEWLVNNTDYGEIALLYIFTHGTWMRNVLLWNDWFPLEWEKLNTSKKVAMVDTCGAEAYIEPIRNDSSPHISLAHCSAHEVGWAGIEEEGLPIIGSVWNYYFCNSLLNPSADLNDDGYISIEDAFNFSTPLQQRYMNETVFTVPEFLEMFHDLGIYPENYDAYPHPVMDDQYPEQLNLGLRPPWRDIAVTNMSASKTVVGHGFITTLNVTIENQGELTEEFNVTLYANTTVIHTVTGISLANGSSLMLTFVWNTTGYSECNYKITVVAEGRPGEMDVADNSMTIQIAVTIPGDIDGDHDVDIFDIITLAGVYGSQEGDPEYIANCDIDGDGDVDIFDIVAACNHYGESW